MKDEIKNIDKEKKAWGKPELLTIDFSITKMSPTGNDTDGSFQQS